MSCSTLLANNNTATLVAANGIVPLGNAIHGYGKGIRLNGNSIQIYNSGYYKISANLSVSVTGTGTITAQLYKNGSPIPGALASATPGAAAAVVNLEIDWLVRRNCCGDDIYTIVLSDSGTVNNVTTYVEKV